MALTTSYNCFVIIILLFWSLTESSQAHLGPEARIKTRVFLSPKFTLEPGLVSNKYFNNIDFPRGHIAIKSFNGEIVDDEGNPIPLHETYLHHWVVSRFYQSKGFSSSAGIRLHRHHLGGGGIFTGSDQILLKNSGVCEDNLHQYFGIGAETRGTATEIPDPYGIEVGNGALVPDGYEEGWFLGVHAIDTRGTEDRMGCTECRCDLYNVTVTEHGSPLPRDYYGGLGCCYDETSCRLKEGLGSRDLLGGKRNAHLRYTVKYVDWTESIVPVKIYILDVTDVLVKGSGSRGTRDTHHCMVEYTVEPCNDGDDVDGCTDTRTLRASFPMNGDVIYGVGHQHAGATGTALYGQDGREICASYPIYGEGYQAGNESGYIVGMTTCYPPSGSVKIHSGETLTLVANYSRTTKHFGVMSLFYLLVAEPTACPPSNRPLQRISSRVYYASTEMNVKWAAAVFGLAVVSGVVFSVFRRIGDRRPDSYEPVV